MKSDRTMRQMIFLAVFGFNLFFLISSGWASYTMPDYEYGYPQELIAWETETSGESMNRPEPPGVAPHMVDYHKSPISGTFAVTPGDKLETKTDESDDKDQPDVELLDALFGDAYEDDGSDFDPSTSSAYDFDPSDPYCLVEDHLPAPQAKEQNSLTNWATQCAQVLVEQWIAIDHRLTRHFGHSPIDLIEDLPPKLLSAMVRHRTTSEWEPVREQPPLAENWPWEDLDPWADQPCTALIDHMTTFGNQEPFSLVETLPAEPRLSPKWQIPQENHRWGEGHSVITSTLKQIESTLPWAATGLEKPQ